MQKTILKILNMQWGNQNKSGERNLKKAKWNKFEINTNLPLVRACRFKSDVHDFSPSYLPLVGSSWRTRRGWTLDLPPHLSFLLLSFRCGGSLFWLGFWCTPECLPFAIMLYHEVLLFPSLKPEKHVLLSDAESDFSSPDIDPCPGSPHEWSPKNELHFEVALYV